MHKRKYYLLLLLGFLILSSVLPAKNNNPQKDNLSFSKISALDPQATLSNINNWSYWLYNDGRSGIDPNDKSGGIYPRGTAGTIFQDGLIWGARVNGNIRVGGQTYAIGTQALLDRIYRIRPDWNTLTLLDVVEEATEFYQTSAVTESQANEIIEQYKKDWEEWPVDKGAPYVDVDHSGTYNPVLDNNGMPDANQGDYPGIEGADQVVWFKADDQDAEKTKNLYGSDPIGVEMDVTVWAYNQRSSKIGQAIFKKYKLKNISTDVFDEMYLSQWVDPDVWDFSDDLVGCDSISSSIFAYSRMTVMGHGEPTPPAIGYTLLQGPVIPSPGDIALFDSQRLPDYKNLPMTSFVYFPTGNPNYSDPTGGYYDGTLEWYNMLRGFYPNTNIENPTPFKHGDGTITKFPVNGDPVLGTGDIDGIYFSPGDRRMALNSGPFILNPGETQEMVIALVGGLGKDNLNSVKVLKENIEEIKGQYGKPILVPKASYSTSHPNNSTTELFFEADLSAFSEVTNCSFVLKPDSGLSESTIDLYDDGSHNDRIAGDNIWSNKLIVQNQKYPLSADLNIYFIDYAQVYENYFERIRFRPQPKLSNWQVVWENAIQDSKINNDEKVHLQFDISNIDSINDIEDLTVWKLYNYISASDLASGSTIDSSAFYFVVEGSSSKDSITFFYHVRFDGHSEYYLKTLPITSWDPYAVWGDTIDVLSIVGIIDNVSPILADPLLSTDHTYRINFLNDTTSNYPLWRLTDVTTGLVELDNLKVATRDDHPHPVMDGIQWQVTTPPLLVKDWTYSSGNLSPLYPDYNRGRWVSGNDWGGGALFGGLGMAYVFWDGPGTVSVVEPADYRKVEFRFTHMTSYNDTSGDGSYTFDANGGEPYSFNVNEGQKAFMYNTWGSGNYSGFNDVPFQVWDVDDPANPRQLNVVVRDRDQNNQWDINTGNGPYNYIWVMADDYDPSGQAWDGSTPEKDFMGQGPNIAMYALWATQRGDRPMLAESGVLTVIPYQHNAPGDILEIALSPLTISKIPVPYILHQNYPNPFNPITQIDFGLIKNGKVKLEIFNILGQKVKTIINSSLAAGTHTAFWDGKNEVGKLTATGLYFYRLSADRFVKTKKMILIR